MTLPLPLMPRAQRMALAGGSVAVGRLAGDSLPGPGCAAALRHANRWLEGFLRQGAPPLPVRFDIADGGKLRPALGDDESYRLRIAADGVRVSAAHRAGAQHALATLVQLAAPTGHLPIGEVEDAPAFPWRGLMLDPARRFISLDTLLKTLDGMAFHKLNVLHLHLTDDQGFRFQSAAYPRLASTPSYRRDELRRLVAEASERGIRVVPELDMPGHVTSWLCAHPEWGPRRASVAPSNKFGPHPSVLNPADEAVYAAIDRLLGELAEVFPDEFVHVGGDEVDPTWWRESTQVANYMADRGLQDANALQAHFIARVAELAARRGKQVIAWDEVLDSGASGMGEPPAAPPSNLWVQAWRGATARGRALAAGRPCILSSGYYLDLFYPADVHHAGAPDAAEAQLLAQEDALLDDPRLRHVAVGLKWTQGWRKPAKGSGAGALLGGEACLWSELVNDELLPVRLWSRMPALADRFWRNQPAPRNLGAWLQASLERLASAGIVDVLGDSRRLLLKFGVSEGQLPAVELLEPVKWYARLLGEAALAARIQGAAMPQARPYQADTPLNRPVDALPPESFAAARFKGLLAQGGKPLIDECQRLLAVCGKTGFAPELTAPIQSLALILKAVLDHAQGRIDAEAALRQVLRGGEPQGEYLAAIAPMAEEWLTRG